MAFSRFPSLWAVCHTGPPDWGNHGVIIITPWRAYVPQGRLCVEYASTSNPALCDPVALYLCSDRWCLTLWLPTELSVHGGPKNRLFLRSDNFATTDDWKVRNMSKVSEFCRMRHRSIMMNFPYYRSANKTIQISRSPKHMQVRLPDKNNQYMFINLSANFYVWQDFLPVRTENTFIWPTIRRKQKTMSLEYVTSSS